MQGGSGFRMSTFTNLFELNYVIYAGTISVVFYFVIFTSEKQISAANIFFSKATVVFKFESFEDG